MSPTFGSLFAGVGGFDLGFDASGPICLHRAPLTMRCSPCSSLFDASLTFSKGV